MPFKLNTCSVEQIYWVLGIHVLSVVNICKINRINTVKLVCLQSLDLLCLVSDSHKLHQNIFNLFKFWNKNSDNWKKNLVHVLSGSHFYSLPEFLKPRCLLFLCHQRYPSVFISIHFFSWVEISRPYSRNIQACVEHFLCCLHPWFVSQLRRIKLTLG